MRLRLMAPMVGLVVLTALAIGALVFFSARAAVMPQALARYGAHSVQLAEMLQTEATQARENLQALSASGIARGILRASEGGGTDPETGLTLGEWQAQLAENFVAELAADPSILQLRLIGADGMEEVRVDREAFGAPPRIIPPEGLQDKNAYPYVFETLELAPGEIYVSDLNLNREFGEVQEPHVPVLRLAMPLAAPEAPPGETYGLLVLNLDMQAPLERVRSSRATGLVYLVNADGDFLLHTDPSREFGFDLGTPSRVSAEMPQVAAALAEEPTGVARLHLLNGTPIGTGWASVALAGGPVVTIIRLAPESELLSGFAIGRAALLGGLAVAALAALLAMLVARSLTQPIEQMTAAVGDGARPRPGDLPTSARGEIGTLARAFADHIDRERWYEEIIEGASDAIFTLSPAGRVTRWNPAAAALFGADAGRMLGRKVDEFLDAAARAELVAGLGQAMKGARVTLELDGWHNLDGEPLALSVTCSPVRGAAGQVTGASLIARDISALRAAQETLRVLVEASPIGKILVRPNGTIDMINAEIERQFGWKREGLVGRQIETLVPNAARASHPALRAEYLAAPVPRRMGKGRDLTARRRDGTTFPVEVALTPVATPDGPRILVASIDISDRKAAMDALRAREEELRRSNADLEQFAYVASHDLQEPLRMVASFTELLAQRYGDQLDEKAQKYIGFAVEGARRMQQQINDLLVYSRVGSRKEPPVASDSGAALRRVLAELDARIRETGAEVELTGDLPMVCANPGNLIRLFQNLVANALKFTGEAPPRIRIAAEESPEGWHFTVADNGIGFDPAEAQRIFDMFQRLNARGKYEGTGLGLAICKRIVEQYGGRIWADAAPGRGATFHFTLPAAVAGTEIAS
ncbi:PAS domain S-box protein [Pseudoroseicyclus sp. CXY001]|uniref:sensor histidine kinase n=1 Tax=Pseudoroseicyclus sp. CXY001 TaxID=3242492 RepID=UPI00357130AA